MKLSVVVPIYNAEECLERCLDSILYQTYLELEVILINDGSTDLSDSICRGYADRDGRIRYYKQENLGVNATRRKGILIASGDYVTFVDADDYLEKDAFQRLAEEMGNNNPDIVLYNVIEENKETSIVLSNFIKPGLYQGGKLKKLYPMMLSQKPFFSFGILPTVYSKLFNRCFLNTIQIEYDDSISFGEDELFVFQCLIHAKSIKVIEFAPYHYVKKQDNSLTWKEQDESSISALQRIMEANVSCLNESEILLKQVYEYITFVRLLKAPQTVPSIVDLFSKRSNRIALYGAGGFGQSLFREYGDRVSLWVDRDYKKYKFLNGQVKDIETLNSNADQYDVVYIAIINETLCKQIKENLREKGIKKDVEFFCINDK